MAYGVKNRGQLPVVVEEEFDFLDAWLTGKFLGLDPRQPLSVTIQNTVNQNITTAIQRVGGALKSLYHYNRSATFSAPGNEQDITINEVNPTRAFVVPTIDAPPSASIGLVGFSSPTSVRFVMTAGPSPTSATVNFYVVEFTEEGDAGPAGMLNLSDLTDVETTLPTGGDSLVFDSSDSTWKNRSVHQRGTRSAQPAAGSVLPGTLYFVTDEKVIERSNGTTWESYGTATAVVGVTSIGINGSIVATGTGNNHFRGNVGIGAGTTAPACELDVNGQIRAIGASTSGLAYIGTIQANGFSSNMLLRRARDTAGTPSAIQSGDTIAAVVVQGHDGTAYGPTNIGALLFNATQNYTTNTKGLEIVFATTPNGSTTRTNRWRIGNAGHLESVNGTELIRWGTTNAFPALKRSGIIVQARLGDDSGVGTFQGVFKPDEATITSTGTQNDVSFSDAGVLRCNNASDLTITGFAAGQAGQRLTVVSVGAGQVYFAHQNSGSVANNRFINWLSTGNTPLAAGKGTATFEYDATALRWRLVAHTQGAPISQPYSAGDFTGSGAMTWGVGSGDVGTYTYYITGRLLHFSVEFGPTTVGGTANTTLSFKIPGNYVANRGEQGVVFAIDSGTHQGVRWFTNGGGSTTLSVMKLTAANWALQNDACYVTGTGFIEVQ